MTHAWTPEPERGAAPGEPTPAWSPPSVPDGPAAPPDALPYALPYAQPYAPPAGTYAPPAQPYAQPYAPPAGLYAPPAQPYAPPYGQPYAPAHRPPYGPPPRRGLPGWAIALIVVGVVSPLLAAIAIPVYLNARESDPGLGDYRGVSCIQAGRDAVTFTEDIALPGEPLLVRVHGVEVFVDRRGELEPPEPGGYELVLTCSGLGEWDDGSSGPILLDVGLEHPAELVISYRPGF